MSAGRTRIAAIALLVLTTAANADVTSVLKKLGEDAQAREATAPCTFKETTTVDELGKDGQVVGSELRLFDVEVNGAEVVRRELVSTTKSGSELADLLAQPRDTKGKKPARSPLHPQTQGEYDFTLKDGPSPEEQTVDFVPKKPSAERMRGEVIVDARTSAMKSLWVTPSKVPLLLKSFEMRFEFTDTACGRQASVVELKGEGIAVFVETKFRSKSILEGHARVTRPPASKKK